MLHTSQGRRRNIYLYALTNRLRVVKKEKVGNMLAKVECKAVFDRLAARETEVKAYTLGDALC